MKDIELKHLPFEFSTKQFLVLKSKEMKKTANIDNAKITAILIFIIGVAQNRALIS